MPANGRVRRPNPLVFEKSRQSRFRSAAGQAHAKLAPRNRREFERPLNETGIFSTWNRRAPVSRHGDRAPYPTSIGAHPGCNALIAIATDSTGQITGGQLIHLDRDGRTLAKAEAHARPTAKGRPSSQARDGSTC